MKTLLFFNNKGGVGKTTLAYHIAWMLSELGHRCLAVDLDPQANLSSMLLSEEEMIKIYSPDTDRATLLAGIKRLDKNTGDIQQVAIQTITDRIGLLAGDLELSLFEDKLSYNWSRCLDRDEAAFRITTAFYRIIQEAANEHGADYCVIDVGPNFGAINRATLLAADYLIVPMAADLFSLQGLKNIGNRLEAWKIEWQDRITRNPAPELDMPSGEMKPLGYVVMQHGIKERRPVKAYLNWANRIPDAFAQFVEGAKAKPGISIENDENCLALLKHYHSLVPMAMETRKPIFLLKPADGAIGAHLDAVRQAYRDFNILVNKILKRM